MMDYKGLEALNAVLEKQNFEAAADHLCITQSAISQRIRALQNYYGDPILIKKLPYRPTKLGEKLITHYKKVTTLENEVIGELSDKGSQFHFSIALSRDMLETWFMSVMNDSDIFQNNRIAIITDDQDLTINYLQQGVVTACFSTSKKALPNCNAFYIGDMRYVMVASPKFQQKYFKSRDVKHDLIEAPAIIFDKNDDLHDNFLEKYFGIEYLSDNYYIMPSVQGFRKYVMNGFAYALIPKINIVNELEKGDLINLFPDKIWDMQVYLHHWMFGHKRYDQIVQKLVKRCSTLLKI